MAAKSKKGELFSRQFMVKPGASFRMGDIDPSSHPGLDSKEDAVAETEEMTRRLSELQRVFYADGRHSLLVVLQGMDTGGKDGTIRHVFGPMNPQGVRVTSFKRPTDEELAHDYLWRIHSRVPPKGMIGIFNRSHYEDVLIVRVHNMVPKREVERRYRQINDFEKYLSENGVTILKFCLHISKGEQKERFLSRLDRADKQWKFNAGDLSERKYWSRYQGAYAKAVSECSTSWAPWHVIPADRKWYRNYAIARIVLETLEGMKLRYPEPEEGLDKVVID